MPAGLPGRMMQGEIDRQVGIGPNSGPPMGENPPYAGWVWDARQQAWVPPPAWRNLAAPAPATPDDPSSPTARAMRALKSAR